MATMGASKVAMTDAATIHVFAVAGSLRRASLNRALLRAAVDLAPEGMTFDVYEDLGSIPHSCKQF